MNQKGKILSIFGAMVWIAIILTGMSMIGKDAPAEAPEPPTIWMEAP